MYKNVCMYACMYFMSMCDVTGLNYPQRGTFDSIGAPQRDAASIFIVLIIFYCVIVFGIIVIIIISCYSAFHVRRNSITE